MISNSTELPDKYTKKKVQIKRDLLKSLPTNKIKSRPALALVLSYYGYRHEVMDLLQVLSHSSRAYIQNAAGLPGFLLNFDLIDILKKLDAAGSLEELKKTTVIDLKSLDESLSGLKIEDQMQLLRSNPGVYIQVLNFCGRFSQATNFIEWCKSFEHGDHREYSMYVHGYLLPWLAE